MTENEISKIVVDCAIAVHKKLGPGLLESVYQKCLAFELMEKGLTCKEQFPIPVIYNDINMEIGFRADIFVGNKVILELKSIDSINDIHLAQVLTYLKLSECKLGMLLNFNVVRMANGIKRVVNHL